jgi:hypothetical protein
MGQQAKIKALRKAVKANGGITDKIVNAASKVGYVIIMSANRGGVTLKKT